MLIQLDNVDEAMKWIKKAEEEGVYPAKVAFLKGVALSKQGKDSDAIKSFEKAKSLIHL